MKNPTKISIVAALASASLALSGCAGTADAVDTDGAPGAATTLSIEHAQGETPVPVNPETVYTFDLGVLDTLDAIGVDVDGLPQGRLPEPLAHYDSAEYTNIGSMMEPDFEAIAAGAPDLIIISGRTAGSYDELSKIAPTIDLSVGPKAPIEDFTRISTTLGEIFQKEAEVAERMAAIDENIARTQAAATTAGNGLIVMTSGGELTAYGAGSRFGLIHDVLEVKTAAKVKADGRHGEAISFEFIAETNPDYLFVIDRDSAIGESGAAAAAVLDNPLVDGTNAAEDQHIIYLDSSRWYLIGYGLNNVDAMITSVYDALHN